MIDITRIGLLGGTAAWLLAASGTASADHFKPLSPDHTSYGVAQLNYGNIAGREFDQFRPVMKLMNPVHITQVAAVLVYESERGRQPGVPEVYSTCSVRVLTPHASIGIPEATFNTPENVLPKYAEVIWAPVEEVSPGRGNGANRRIADGLGGAFDNDQLGRSEGEARLAHPGLFSLPSDDVVPGQRQTAIDCVLDALSALGLSTDIFSDFGIE